MAVSKCDEVAGVNRKIALYFYKYGNSGVARVISCLIPMYLSVGYELVLLTDEQPSADDYELPAEVKRYVIPRLRVEECTDAYAMSERGRCITELLTNEHVDIVCHHAVSSDMAAHDLAVVKGLGIRFIFVKHELFSQHISFNKDVLSRELKILPKADMLVVLAKEESVFWRALGVKNVYIPNPMVQALEGIPYCDTAMSLVWVGRLDRHQKRYQDIVPIMEQVVRALPGCVLRIYGKTEGYQDARLLNEQILDAHLEHNVHYCGYSTNLEEIYKDAGVLLVTSAYESFGMNIYESKQLGIPLVTYSMPYLELLKNRKGYLEVEQGDTKAAAEAIVRVLTDPEYRRRLSREAKESVRVFSNEAVMCSWERVFQGRLVEEHAPANEELYGMFGTILRTMIYHTSLGIAEYQSLYERYQKKRLDELKRVLKERELKLAVYPYGVQGERLKAAMEDAGMCVELLVDNHLAGRVSGVLSVEQLRTVRVEDYLFVICSDNSRYYDEIRQALYEVVPKEYGYDWYPLHE